MAKTSLRVLRLPAVESRTGLKKSQISLLERQGKFPRRIKISERAAGWLESEIDQYIAKRVALSRGQNPQQPSA